MVNTQDRIQIVQRIISAAKKYRDKLVGKSFLYVFDNRYIEVLFRTKDFLHLTGVQPIRMSAREFYKEAINGTLRDTQITFTRRHPYDLCEQKSKYLGQIEMLTNSGILMLESVTTDSHVYQFAAADLVFTICFDHDTDDAGIKQSDYFIPRSLRVEDSFSRAGTVYEVDYIFEKSNQTAQYCSVLYASPSISPSDLPDAVKKKLDISLFK